MKTINFKGANTIAPLAPELSRDESGIAPVLALQGYKTYCWEPNEEELQEIMEKKKIWVTVHGPQNTQFFADGIRPFNIKEEPPILDVEAEVIKIQEEMAKAAELPAPEELKGVEFCEDCGALEATLFHRQGKTVCASCYCISCGEYKESEDACSNCQVMDGACRVLTTEEEGSEDGC